MKGGEKAEAIKDKKAADSSKDRGYLRTPEVTPTLTGVTRDNHKCPDACSHTLPISSWSGQHEDGVWRPAVCVCVPDCCLSLNILLK